MKPGKEAWEDIAAAFSENVSKKGGRGRPREYQQQERDHFESQAAWAGCSERSKRNYMAARRALAALAKPGNWPEEVRGLVGERLPAILNHMNRQKTVMFALGRMDMKRAGFFRAVLEVYSCGLRGRAALNTIRKWKSPGQEINVLWRGVDATWLQSRVFKVAQELARDYPGITSQEATHFLRAAALNVCRKLSDGELTIGPAP